MTNKSCTNGCADNNHEDQNQIDGIRQRFNGFADINIGYSNWNQRCIEQILCPRSGPLDCTDFKVLGKKTKCLDQGQNDN